MWELDHEEGWAPKNWCFWTVVLERTLESPLDSKEIKSVNPKGNQSWIFIGRTDAEAEAPILWSLDGKSQVIRKDPDAGKDCGQEEKDDRGWDGWMTSLTVDMNLSKEMVKDRAVCYSPWGHRELDITEQLNSKRSWRVLVILFLCLLLNKQKQRPRQRHWTHFLAQSPGPQTLQGLGRELYLRMGSIPIWVTFWKLLKGREW